MQRSPETRELQLANDCYSKHCSACWADLLRKLTFEPQSIHAVSQPILYLDNVPADSLAEVSEMFSTLRETRRDLPLVLHTEPD